MELSRVALLACLCACLLVAGHASSLRITQRGHSSSKGSSSIDHAKSAAAASGAASAFKHRGTNDAADSMGTQDGENFNNKKSLESTQNRVAANNNADVNPIHMAYLIPHNVFRARMGIRPLVWNTTMAAMSDKWANYLAGGHNCGLQHGGLTIPGTNEEVGQNLASYGSTDRAPQPPSTGIKMWTDEGLGYMRSSFPRGCRTGECGHFTQVVWRDTTSVGCAAANCDSGGFLSTVWVCNYYPAGNIIGEVPY